MNSFTFGGVSSDSFGIRIESKDIFSAPEYDMTFQSIPGRNGELIIPNRRFNNITVSYTCFIKKNSVSDLADAIKRIKAWLYSGVGEYRELTDTYDTQYFRYAVLRGSLDIEEQLNKIGSFTVFFSCRPFKLLKTGVNATTYRTSSITLTNPESYDSKPLIIVNGTGNITFSVSNSSHSYSETVTITGLTSKVTIDSENMNCYNGSTLLNSNVTFSDTFPVLKPGTNVISISGSGFSSIAITPRWCAL